MSDTVNFAYISKEPQLMPPVEEHTQEHSDGMTFVKPKKSILKTSLSIPPFHDEARRVSFSNNHLVDIVEVENWKEYNIIEEESLCGKKCQCRQF